MNTAEAMEVQHLLCSDIHVRYQPRQRISNFVPSYFVLLLFAADWLICRYALYTATAKKNRKNVHWSLTNFERSDIIELESNNLSSHRICVGNQETCDFFRYITAHMFNTRKRFQSGQFDVGIPHCRTPTVRTKIKNIWQTCLSFHESTLIQTCKQEVLVWLDDLCGPQRFVWLYSESTRPSHDSILIWQKSCDSWLNNYDSATSLGNTAD